MQSFYVYENAGLDRCILHARNRDSARLLLHYVNVASNGADTQCGERART